MNTIITRSGVTAGRQAAEGNILPSAVPDWKPYEITVFRFAFLFLVILSLPLDGNFFRQLFFLHPGKFQDWFQLANYQFRLFPAQWGLAAYASWGVAFVLALTGTIIWDRKSRHIKEHARLYALLRILLRYRLALAAITYGIVKLFPLQLPAPALSDLYTPYGDFLLWKVYYHTNGIAHAYYQQTIGLLEILGGTLLLSKRTTTPGVILLILLLANITVANFAYELGNHVYSSYLLLIALVLFWYDLPRLYSLVVNNKFTRAVREFPLFSEKFFRVRRFGKPVFIGMLFLFFFLTYYSYSYDRWPYPQKEGLDNTYGYYNVKEFSLNGRSYPYSLTDTVRWQNVVFEKWNAASIRINKPVPIDLSIATVEEKKNGFRNYEIQGNGGRHYFDYTADTIAHTIQLQNKQVAGSPVLSFSYNRPDNNTIILTGISDDSRIVLERQDKTHLLLKGRRNAKIKF